MTSFRVIGRSIPPVNGREKVTGAAVYTPDVALPGTIWGKILRSPFAHARIVSIDTREAENLPGVHAVVTGSDAGDGLYGMAFKDIPPLARDVVRFVGEPVAAVAADDEDIARAAIDLIDVSYAELPAAIDVFEAMKPDAPVIHPDFNSYKGVRASDGETSGLPRLTNVTNVYNVLTSQKGDLETGFAEADLIVENEFSTMRTHQAYLEPQNSIVQVTEDGRVEAWVSCKTPYNARESLATAVGIAEADIVIHPTLIGGDFGGKIVPLTLPICYLLAKKSRRPVRLIFDYSEELLAGNGRHAVVVRMRTGVRRDGTLTAHQVWYYANCGAYGGYKPGGLIWGPAQAAGIYKVDNCRVDQYHVYTNTVPGGFMRAPGEVQAFFAIESQIDEAAHALGLDPLEMRLRNLIEDGDESGIGMRYEGIRAKETLLAAAEAARYADPKARLVGRGIGICHKPAGGGEGNSLVSLRRDGRIVVGTPIFDQGTGTYAVIRQVVAEELQVTPERIEIEVWETGRVKFDSGIAASRAARVNSAAAHAAAREVLQQLFRLAVQELGWREESLSLRGETIWSSELEESIGWPELLERAGVEVAGEGHFLATGRALTSTFSVQIAEVRVDPETGQVSLQRYTTAHDVGNVINPMAHQGQIYGGVVQGLGYAMMEEMPLADGAVSSLSFGDYKIPCINDLPPITTVLLDPGAGVGPYDIKGIGEPPVAAAAPAIANAIYDATGVRLHSLPLTAESVYTALKQRV